MTRVRHILKRFVKWAAGTEDLPPTRLSEEEAIGLARAAAERVGLGLDETIEPIGAWAAREDKAGQSSGSS